MTLYITVQHDYPWGASTASQEDAHTDALTNILRYRNACASSKEPEPDIDAIEAALKTIKIEGKLSDMVRLFRLNFDITSDMVEPLLKRG